jgi:hypothetical protein
MAKEKKIIFSNPEATIAKYSSKEVFCEDAQGTVWCNDEFYNNLVSPIMTYGEIYIISVHSPIKGDYKILLIRSDNEGFRPLYDKNGEFVRSSSEKIFNDEKFVLANTDYIAVGYQMTGAASPVGNLLTVTVSTLSV